MMQYMLVLYPAKENNCSEHKDVVADLFIVGLFIVYTWAKTTAFIGVTIAFKHIRDDVFSTDDDMRDVCPGYTFHHNASTSAAGSGSVTPALSVGNMAASDEPGNIQLLLVLFGCIRMPYYMWKRQYLPGEDQVSDQRFLLVLFEFTGMLGAESNCHGTAMIRH